MGDRGEKIGASCHPVNPTRPVSMSLPSLLYRFGGRMVADGLDILVPPRCAVCHDDLPSGRGGRIGPGGGSNGPLLCPSCHGSLMTDSPRCSVCGERTTAVPPCQGCRRMQHGCSGLAVLGGYGDQLRTAILRCKRPGRDPLTTVLAGLIVSRHRPTFAAWGVGLVVPVPMHWSRRMMRGTSAADELAGAVAVHLRLPCDRVLRRVVATRMQNELPVTERRGNVATAFRVRGMVKGKRILLVDDVCTTGATLAACSEQLTAAGAQAVYAAVVAKADRSSDPGDD